MFIRFDKLEVWHKSNEPYSRYVKGNLEDHGNPGIVFRPEKPGYEIWNPTLDTLYLKKEGKL